LILSVHHISFTVGDIDRSIKFYKNLGFKVDSDRRGLAENYLRNITGYSDAIMNVTFLSGYNMLLELIEYVQPSGVNLDKSNYNIGSAHICFEVDNVKHEYDRLTLEGVVFRSLPVEIDTGINAGRVAVYFYDPDGYTLELHSKTSTYKP
jgi:catechol 2,3-dioxygenase-like lactoylglutathione lyase family enzyme